MKVGVISDVHSNLPALNAVLDDMPDVDIIISLGDVIGYGPHSQQVAEKVDNTVEFSLRGNHETYLEYPERAKGNEGAYEGIKHAENNISDSLYEWLTTTPMRDVVDGSLGVVHGHPDENNPYKYITPNNVTELIPTLSESEYSLLGAGHSHHQFKQDLRKFDDDSGVVFNPGSVGQPRDKDPRAGYAVVDTETLDVDLYRVEYDIEKVIEAIEDADLPSESGERLKFGRMPRR